ncbi:MAG: response regulator transcription factor [Pseudobdellovibrionaceae bacterium]
MNKKNLMIVDDDKNLCEVLSSGLSDDFNVTTTEDADIAFRIAVKNQPDIILLDILLKNQNGIELCHKLRQNQITKKIPVLMFTGHGSKDRMISSFEFGADDYIEKPIDLEVLKTRLLSRLKRMQDIVPTGTAFGNLKMFPDRFEVELDGKVHKLSEIEFDLLRIFLINPNKKISREEILGTIWNDVKVTERTVDVHVSSLRKKLKDFNYNIKSMYGTGYILRPTNKEN